jgi:5-methylcytosine-specific restriction endonuclease McrA
MDSALEELVWQRANRCCEYCRVCQDFDRLPFEIDHIVARKHGGLTTQSNLCLACFAWK